MSGPRSPSTASESSRLQAAPKAARRPNSETLRAVVRKRHSRREGRCTGSRLFGVQETGHAAHESLIGSETAADVPLTGLSFCDAAMSPERVPPRRCR